jgi:capsule polysaccharide export protein KpsE/RkpR
MNRRVTSGLKIVALTAALTALFPLGSGFAADQGESFTPSLMAPAAQEDTAAVIRRLQSVKKDLEVFQTFAEHFSNSGDTKTATQLQAPLDDYLKKHVDSLVAQATNSPTLEATRLSAEILILKTRIFMYLNRAEAARETVDDMKRRFAPYQKIAVQLPGKTSTLDEVIRQLDDELSKSASIRK